jgi:hypothetical protein
MRWECRGSWQLYAEKQIVCLQGDEEQFGIVRSHAVSGGLESTVTARLAMKRPTVTTDAVVKKSGGIADLTLSLRGT